jgi:hypothetical protein
LKTKELLLDGSGFDFMFPYEEMYLMSSGSKMAAAIRAVTYVFIKKGKLSIHIYCPYPI